MPDRISVVIPTFNCGRYLPEILGSVLGQTRPADELIVVDDGSTDDTADVVAHTASGATYISQANAGVATARNAGLARATGDWVMFLDADDRLEPRALDLLLAGARTGEAGVVYGDKHRIADDGVFIDAVRNRDCEGEPPAAARACWGGAAFEPGAAIVSRALAVSLGGFDQRFAPCEDRHFWIRCGALAAFRHVPDVVLHYRIRPGSHSKHRARQVTASVRTRIELLGWLEREGVRLFAQDEPAPSTILEDDLEAVYWTREWDVVDALLSLSDEYRIDTPRIRSVRRRRRLPPWMLRAKDLLDRSFSG